MRVFIVLLFLSCFHFSAANAKESGRISAGQKSVIKANPILDRVNISAKKDNSSLNQELFFEHINRIHQTINHQHFTSAIYAVQSYLNFASVPTEAIKTYSNKVNYNYLFIFNCLYPKHTFW